MITAHLEKLILEKKAIFKTHNHGVAGVGLIDNPNNRTIIITKIIYHPFLDYSNKELRDYGLDVDALLSDSSQIHTLRLISKENSVNYTFRDELKINQDLVNNRLFITGGSPIVLDTYFVVSDVINFNIMGIDNLANTNYPFSPLPDESLQPSYPLGYGTISEPINLLSVTEVINSDPSGTAKHYYPLGKKFNPFSVPNVFYQFIGEQRLNIMNGNVTNTNNFKYPMVTFEYVELLDKYKAGATIK